MTDTTERAEARPVEQADCSLYNPWRTSLENCISGDNYLRASEYRELIEELDDLYLYRSGQHESLNDAYANGRDDQREEDQERIASLEAEVADLHTTMMAAAVEIQEHWDAHRDAEGYGPANLMHRLERGIASQYGYDAKTLLRAEAERDKLRAEVERLRADAERWTALRASNFQMVMHSKGKRVFWSVRPIFTNYEYSLFDSQDQAADSLRNEQKEKQ